MTDSVPTIDPSHSILLVMDYEPAIIGSLPALDELLAHASGAIAIARTRGMYIGYVRVAFAEADYAAVPATNKGFSATAMAGRRMDDGTPGTAVHEAVAPQPGDIVVRKTRVGAFSTTDLAEQLRALSIDTLVLAGVSTSGVVLSTVRDGADHDYRIYVLEDACADRDSEVQDVLMHKVFPRQAWVISTAELPALLGPQ
ncbi:MAG: cysteine hydrolase [Coriobacteriia bacterium]|nr:cysteine hydrolase [Coriobacteriia bacterium]